MIIESQLKRLWWRMFLLGFAVDALIALGLAWFFADEGERLMTALLIWLAIQVAAMVMQLRFLLHALAAWHSGQAESVENGFLAQLQKHEFPFPRTFESSVSDYLERIAGDEDLPDSQRIAAAAMAGGKSVLPQTIGIIRGVLVEGAHERALARYR